MQEQYLLIKGEWHFLRHSEIRPGRRTILFLHGLGESSLCFREAFEWLHKLDYNLVAPDNIGYGRSSMACNGDYSFKAQIARLSDLAFHLGLQRLTLVGHSLGGDLATYWSKSDGLIERLVNIEGNMMPNDGLFSAIAVEAYQDAGRDFNQWCGWFRDTFLEKLVLARYGYDWESYRRYYASLWFCRPEAFLANSLEIIEKSQPIEGALASEIGLTYASVQLPKVYCWGAKSLGEPAQEFLNQVGLANRAFPGARHWPMIDLPEAFYVFLTEWLS